LREYATRRNGIFVLPPLESNFHHCYHQLFGLLNSVSAGSTILMYSLLMLPDNQKLSEFRRRVSVRQVRFAFVLENIEGSIDDVTIRNALESYQVKALSKPIEEALEYFGDVSVSAIHNKF